MAIRVMLDSDIIDDLTGHVEWLATYSDLVHDETAFAELKARFPNSDIILIDRGLGDPTDRASVIDIETGAHTIDDLPGWVERKKAKGVRYLTGYCDRSNLPGVLAIVRHGLWHWVATLDGTTFIHGWNPLHGPAVVQILGADKLDVHADLSLIMEDGWHPRG